MQKPLTLTLDMNVLNHLGIGLYASAPAVLTELVANAWDADAKDVAINLDLGAKRIDIMDDGHGMNTDTIQTKFLTVGYARREKEGTDRSLNLQRPVMGRKGIGKLSMFSLARRIDIFSSEDGGQIVSAAIDVQALQEKIRAGQPYILEPADDTVKPPLTHGTALVLRDLTRDIGRTPRYLVERIARRFSVIGSAQGFSVKVNGHSVTLADRGFYGDVQFFWYFDANTDSTISALTTNLASVDAQPCKRLLDSCLDFVDPRLTIRGYIATVDKPKKLRALDANLNQISIFARGRLFQEDILGEIGNSKVFNNYIVGEIHADFLDDDDVDRATASRESIKHDDPRYVTLRSFLARRLSEIERDWDEWRRALGYSKSEEPNEVVSEWLSQLTNPLERRLAEKLVTNISNTRLGNDETEAREQKAMLYRSAIVGFEKLRAREQLHRLADVEDVLSPEFAEIFASLNDIEETYYHEITTSRIEVIDHFRDIVNDEELEKVAQKYLFRNLWLLDPTWGRVTGSEETEKILTAELRGIDRDSDEGARLDITFRTGSGKCVIVELKRPGKFVPFDVLLAQGRKYRNAVIKWLTDHPDAFGFRGRAPPIDLFFLVSRNPVQSEDDYKSLAAYNGQVLTYEGLIVNAKKAYEEYLQVHSKTSRIDAIISKL
jgi:Histidine kinase-, DNA gyrase B-, and HSP90-like ATPase